MSDLIELGLGRVPWEPTSGAQLVDVFHRYDRPLIGVFAADDSRFFFACVAGEAEPLSAWWYCQLRDDDLDRLRGLDGSELPAVVGEMVETRPGVLALAMEGEGIVITQQVDNPGLVGELFGAMSERFQIYLRNVDAARGSGDLVAAGFRGPR